MADDLKAQPAGSRQALLLQVWLSPSFPAGAFAYSHGLEWAVEAGLIMDRRSLAAWVADLLAHGSIGNDLTILAATWRAASSADWSALREIAELAAALHPSAERRLESNTQGGSFLDAMEAAWPVERNGGLPPFEWVSQSAGRGQPPLAPRAVAYPVAVGTAAADHGVALEPLLEAYATAFAGNLASAAIRLGVIGQTDAQRLLAGLLPAIANASGQAAASTLNDLGSATWSADLCSLEHETQYTRLFRS